MTTHNKGAELPEEFKNVLIGGNHLASALLGIADPAPYRNADYYTVLEKHGQPYADMWVAWKAIMNFRDYTDRPQTRSDAEPERSALAWVKAQAKALSNDVDETWSVFFMTRLIANHIKPSQPAVALTGEEVEKMETALNEIEEAYRNDPDGFEHDEGQELIVKAARAYLSILAGKVTK